MNPLESVAKPQTFIIGVACETSNEPSRGPQDIPALWQKFYSEGVHARIPNKLSDDVYALYCDYESDHTGPYTCVIGCPVTTLEEIPEGMVGKVILASTYAQLEVKGEFPASLIQAWGRIWNTPLERTYTVDFEHYGAKFADSKELDIFIAIKS